MKKLSISVKLLSFAAIVSLAAGAYAQNIVQDAGFELSPPATSPPAMPVSGPFSAFWTVADTSNNSNVGHTPSLAFEGSNHANLGATGVTGTLSQMLATVVGQSYALSFALANDSLVGGPNSFKVFFGNTMVFTLTNGPASPYTVMNFSVVASSLLTNLRFVYQNDDDFFRLDAISVTARTAATPEGGMTLWLIAPAFAGLALLHLRLNRRASDLS